MECEIMTDTAIEGALDPRAQHPWGEPFARIGAWLAEAEQSEPNDPNAMALATVGEDGMPSVRMVLLKGYDETGFVFYTNYESKKGRQILHAMKAAIVLHWKSLRRQIRVEGEVEKVSDAEADAYYHSRPRSSQLGAWASIQSRPMENRFDLEKRVALFTAKHPIGTIPRPPHWSGFRIKPHYIEFWEDRPFRLHDRLIYKPAPGLAWGEAWVTEKLYP
jgi:pyridoxamine 5'-phosphate oxidase